MKIFTNKKVIQKIVIAILIVLSFNFITPTFSMANVGGALLDPIFDLLATIADAVVSGLQYFMFDGRS